MARYEHLPIYKKMFDLTVYVEDIVKNFSRYHKYTLGSELRTLSHRTLVLIVQANSTKDKKKLLEEVRDNLEEMKILGRICKELKAYGSFKSFEVFVKSVVDVSRQCERQEKYPKWIFFSAAHLFEGWLRSLNPS